jgi:phenylpropionate dioxygenase-like ring-hydroxylating dioxygenase large terminal subunit
MTTDVSGVMRPVATANGLPNDHYVDERIFLEERDAVLYNNWSGIAVAADVPENGDA